jgi:hypothetical protein
MNAYNNFLSIAFLHLCLKYAEFSLIPGRYIDPYTARGRPKWRSALDLCINSRMVGLQVKDSDGQDVGSVKPLREDQRSVTLASNSKGSISPLGSRPRSMEVVHQPFLPRPIPTASGKLRTRFQAIRRHAALCLAWLWFVDTLVTVHGSSNLSSLISGDPTVTAPHTISDNLITRFARDHSITLFPSSPRPLTLPAVLVEFLMATFVASGVCAGLIGGYHGFAVLGLLAGWEVDSWEVDLMDSPWRGTSLLDVWGRRWHQVFRVSWV